MIKVTCDIKRCGKELPITDLYKRMTIGNNSYHLCDTCRGSFFDWIDRSLEIGSPTSLNTALNTAVSTATSYKTGSTNVPINN